MRVLFRFLCPALAAAVSAAGGGATPARACGDGQTGYTLGPGDQVSVRVQDVEEIREAPLRIETNGILRLPLVGSVTAAGLAVGQLESEIAARLRVYVREPQVSVSVTEFRSQPVSVLGAVSSPGVLQLQGSRNLFEILSMAGGLRQDAGAFVKLARRKEWGPIPLPGAAGDASGGYSVAEVSVKSVMEARNPGENIVICPNDVITVPRAEMVYVAGAVKRAGGFVLNEKEHLTVLQALSLAEGLDRAAAPGRAKILRPGPDGEARTGTAIDLRRIISGQAADMPLRANEILFVPTSAAKGATLRGLEAAVQIGTGVAIWRR